MLRKIRNSKAFTLIELLVVVVIIGILAAIALPNFIGAQTKAKVAGVKANMHTCQLCAESYATDAGGAYPTAGTELGPYYPGGASTIGGTTGTLPANPITNKANEALATATVTLKNGAIDRTAAPAGGTKGQTAYAGISNNTSYAVAGFNDQGTAIVGSTPGSYMILSNQ